jgi:acyl dehydratase
MREPEAFAAAADRTYVDAMATAQELAELHRRYAELGGYERAMQRLARATKALERMRSAHVGDRLGFALALATAETYLEIVALQVSRQHDASLSALIDARRKLVIGLEIAAVLVVAAIVFVTRRYVQRSFTAVNTILANDARRSLLLSDSRDAVEALQRERDVLLRESAARALANAGVNEAPAEAPGAARGHATRFLEDFTPGQRFASPETVFDEARIRGFAARFDPFHLDDEAARAAMAGGLAASGWQTAAVMMRLLAESGLRPEGGLVGAGFDELRWLRPVRPGDALRLEIEVIEVRAARSKPHEGIVKLRITTLNHGGEPVLACIANIAVPRRNAA